MPTTFGMTGPFFISFTSSHEREAYVQAVLRAVKPGGHVIVATFAEDGPERCSGLPEGVQNFV